MAQLSDQVHPFGVGSWRITGKGSKRGPLSPLPRFHEADEMRAAESLLLLSHSGGGICLLQTEYSHPTAQNLCYECSLCGQAFPSHKALGGHKTSHRRTSSAAMASENVNLDASASTATLDASAPIPSAGLHRCSVCHLNFPTGRALGGHMRKHYRGNVGRHVGAKCRMNSFEGGGGSSAVTSFSDGGGAGSHSHGDVNPVHGNLDLNLPPPPGLDLRLNCYEV